MDKYIIETTTGHVLAEDNDKDRAVCKARAVEPTDTLIGTLIRENGSQAGFYVGKVPF